MTEPAPMRFGTMRRASGCNRETIYSWMRRGHVDLGTRDAHGLGLYTACDLVKLSLMALLTRMGIEAAAAGSIIRLHERDIAQECSAWPRPRLYKSLVCAVLEPAARVEIDLRRVVEIAFNSIPEGA